MPLYWFKLSLFLVEAGHPDAIDLTGDYLPGNPDAMNILTLGLGSGRVFGLELGHQDVPDVTIPGVSFLASGRSCQDVADSFLVSGKLVVPNCSVSNKCNFYFRS